MTPQKNIVSLNSLRGINYSTYLQLKATLPDAGNDFDLLQFRWIITHVSYLDQNAVIMILGGNNSQAKGLAETIRLILPNTDLVFDTHKQCDCAIILKPNISYNYEEIYTCLKSNGFMAVHKDAKLENRKPVSEICNLKIYQKPLIDTHIDFKIHIFIPVHNNISNTVRCLDSVYQQTIKKSFKVTVIDDGSTDNTKHVLKEKFPDVSIIDGHGALWWTGAICMGIEKKCASFETGDFFLILNNDIVLQTNTIFTLLQEAVRDRSVCVAPLGFVGDESIACGEASDGHIFYRFELSSQVMAQNGNSFSVLSLFGRCTLFPVEILQNIDNFDAKTFPHYYGDTDFCLRAAKFGYKFKISGKTSIDVQHDSGTTGTHYDFFSKRRSFKEVFSYLTDIKSLGNIKYMWRYLTRHYPKGKHQLLIKTIFNAIRQAL